MNRWAVVLAGGVGSRFWPVSTPATPKQLLPLATQEPMLVDTLRRLAPLVPAERTLVLTNAGLVDAIARMAPELPRGNLIAEPRPAGTAAALAWATHEIARRGGRDAVMMSVHSDSAILDADAFRATLAAAAEAAERERALVTVGIVPERPDTGYGYIQPGEPLGPGLNRVARFVEKPDLARAEAMVRDGFLWNSGIFVWRAGDFLDELAAHTPEVAPQLAAHADDMAAFFASVTSGIAVDVGVLERSSRMLVVAGSFGWDDVGTWSSLRRVRAADSAGNASSGTVHALDARDNVVHAGGNAVVLYGVSGLVVVTHGGLTLVTTTERATDLKTLIASLPPSLRDLA
ncbi:MAG: Nucleotidyl transferase [Gemmatimonadetes bacterium]|jgi:mannose-1-phosphate guanylyltransferase|nr:Nucleotidyl transferase [Gemmatimonadota bacterium]